MQMAMAIKIRNLLLHDNQLDDETVICRVDRLVNPSSMKYTLFPVSFLQTPSSAYHTMFLNSTPNGLPPGFIRTTDIQRRETGFASVQGNASVPSTHQLLNTVHPLAI